MVLFLVSLEEEAAAAAATANDTAAVFWVKAADNRPLMALGDKFWIGGGGASGAGACGAAAGVVAFISGASDAGGGSAGFGTAAVSMVPTTAPMATVSPSWT